LLRELVLERVEVHDAFAEIGLEDPEVMREVNTRKRLILRRQFTRNEVRNKLIPSDEELRRAYESRIDEFTSPETRRFVAINVPDVATATEISTRVGSGEDFMTLVQEYSAADSRIRATDAVGTPAMLYGQSPALDDVLFNIELREVSPPIPVGESFTVARVIEIKPLSVKSFDEARIEIQRGIVDERTEVRLQELRDQARKAYPLVIDPDALRKVRFTRD